MGFNSGTVNRRTKPKLEVLRNFAPTLPEGYTHSAKVKDGVTVLSGQAMILNTDGEWELADANTSAHLTAEIFIALDDGVAYDALAVSGEPTLNGEDEKGTVVGYSTAGQYEFESAYYDTPGTYVAGTTFLTISETAGNLAATTADSGLPIVGRVSRPVKSLNGINSNVPLGTNVLVWRTGYHLNSAIA